MKGIRSFSAAISPALVAEILMHAYFTRQRATGYKVGQYHCNMAYLRNDRVHLIRLTLSVTARMDMDIGDNDQTRCPAMRPKGAEAAAVDFNDACRKSIRIDIVIKDEFLDHFPLAMPAEQKGASFALTIGSTPKLIHPGLPNFFLTDEFRRRPEDDTHER
jgi:hypothetical protein